MDVLYVSDMDGTLLHSDGTLSEQTIAMMTPMLEDGLAFTVATARSNVSALPLLEKLPLRLPLILVNGAILYDPIENKPIHISTIPVTMAQECIDIIKDAGLFPLLYTHDAQQRQRIYHQELTQGAQQEHVLQRMKGGDPRFRKVKDFRERFHEQCFYVTTTGTQAQLNPIAETFTARGISYHFYYDVYTQGYFLECCPPGVSKGTAIEMLREMLSPKKVIAFGDNHNDIAMFSAAEESCAMANAQPEVLSAATYTIDSNDNHGVASFIHQNRHTR